MNRTQCRTTSADFLVDPLLKRQLGSETTVPQEGYLVGAYWMELELLTWRKLRFPNGIKRGDLIVFPNTAGYLIHFLGSRSHQYPLAKNLIIDTEKKMHLDSINCFDSVKKATHIR